MSHPLHLELSGAWLAEPSEAARELATLGPLLDKLRDEICDLDEKMLTGEIPIPPSKLPLENGFVGLPKRMLADYESMREASPVGRMLAATKQLMTEVDRVVVLGDAQTLSGPQALMQACCQPYFNEFSRGERGSRPRVLFVGDSFDNDAVQGLLHLLGAHRGRVDRTLEERWALVVIGPGVKPSHVPSFLSPLLAALRTRVGGDQQLFQSRILLVASDDDSVPLATSELEHVQRFAIPSGVGSRFSVLSMIGLLPAALLGINVMKLLEGARGISDHFQRTKAVDNLVLRLAGVNHLMECKSGNKPLAWSLSCQALTHTGRWYQQLLQQCLGRELLIKDSLTIEPWLARNSWNENSANEKSQWNQMFAQILATGFRFDRLPIVEAAHHPSERALQLFDKPVVKLSLPQVDEQSVGELLQSLMLATVVEGRLVGCNPYA